MKKVTGIFLTGLLVLSLIGCGSGDVGTAVESLSASYYEGQSARAFQMFQKSIFKNLADDWTGEDPKDHPVWNYDSFTRYDILDGDMASVSQDDDLYYCTYSADNGKTGYVVLSYDGDSLSNISLSETAYPYDLRANLKAIATAVSETEIDLDAATATRVRLTNAPDADSGQTREAIRVIDGAGHDIFCYFGEDSITVEPAQADS